MAHLGRRAFIRLLGGAAAWPLAAAAQQLARLPTIGFLGATGAAGWRLYVEAFERRLRELGWAEDRSVSIIYRWGEGRPERFAEIAAEFVRLNVDVIVTAGSAVSALKQATSVIPVVFATATDPVGGGLVASLSRPGGNITGLSNQGADLAGKRLEFLRETLPGLRRLAILGNAGYRDSILEMREAESAARNLGVDSIKLEIRRAEDIAPAFATLEHRADALYLVGDGLIASNREHIMSLVRAQRLPTISYGRNETEAGGLISYGPNFSDLFRRTGEIVDKILRGAKPADLPVEQPTKFDLVINLKTGKTLGIEFPPKLLALADEVIE